MTREDWIECRLIDACEIHDNLRRPVNSKERAQRIQGKIESDLFPYYGATGQVGLIDGYLSDGTYVLIGEDGAPFLDYTKNVAYKISGKSWVNNHAHVLKSKFDDDFLLHYLNCFNYTDFVSGTTRYKLTQGKLRQIPIKLAPLPEQRAIVARIEQLFSDLDNGIADLNKAREQLKIYRQAVLKKAFAGDLTREWREKQTDLPTADELLAQIKEERQKYYEKQFEDCQTAVKEWEFNGKVDLKPIKPQPAKSLSNLTKEEKSELPEIPHKWKWETIGNLCNKLQIGPFGTQLHKHDYSESGIPIINPKHIKDQKLNPQIYILETKAKSLPQYQLKENDVILGRRGEMGRTAFITKDQNNWFCGTGSLFIRFGNKFSGKFYSLLLSERRVVNYFYKNGGGTTMTNLNADIVNKLPIPLISLKEQEQIVQEIERRLSVCDKVEQIISESLEKAEALRQSILKKAFEGRLLSEAELEACRKEKDYEPACELLKKIKAEKLRNGEKK